MMQGYPPLSEEAHKPPLSLTAALERQRGVLEKAIFDAHDRVRGFAERFGWECHMDEPFIDGASFFDNKDDFDSALRELLEMDPAAVLPKTFCACLEERRLMAVSPELYAQLYPQGVEEKSFEKLLAHEIAHRLHIRILDGDEDRMGPVWFFEGFAIFAADQFAHSTMRLTPAKIWEIVRQEERGSYEQYSVVLDHFLRRASLPALAIRAGESDFLEWLAGLPNTRG